MTKDREEKLKQALKDKNLSSKAKGLFAYLLYFEGERVGEMALKEGVMSIRGAFQELQMKGYTKLSMINGKGKKYTII